MKSLFFLLSVCLLIVFAGCGHPATTTPPPSTTTPPPSTTSFYPGNIYVEIPLCQNDPERKIVIDNVTVTSSTLDRDYYTPASGQHVAGEPCFIISGNIKNGYNEDCWVAYHIDGFDASDNRISTTLETGPLPGWGQVYLAADSSMPFTLHLNWSDNVTGFLISSQRTTRAVPSPSPVENISLTIKPIVDDPEGKIIIDNVTVVASTLDNRPYSPLHGIVKAGDPCWLVSGRFFNGYNENYWVAYHAHGFDVLGNEVSYTLDEGPIAGVESVFIYGRSFEILTLHLSWADNVTSVTISSQMSSIMPP